MATPRHEKVKGFRPDGQNKPLAFKVCFLLEAHSQQHFGSQGLHLAASTKKVRRELTQNHNQGNVLLFHKGAELQTAQRAKQPSTTGMSLIHGKIKIKIQQTAAARDNGQTKPQPRMQPCSYFCRSRRLIQKSAV